MSDYSIVEKEIICGLKAGAEAAAWQETLANEIVDDIENKPLENLYNHDKIKKYRKQANMPQPTEEDDVGDTASGTLRTISGWINSARLALGRIHRLMGIYKLGFLPRLFSFFGFIYFVDLAADLADIVWTTFKPLRPAEQNLMAQGTSRASIYWARFKNKFTQDDELIPRLFNSVVWIGLNLSIFLLTGGIGNVVVAPMITELTNRMNLGGWLFDVGLSAYRGIRDYFRHVSTYNKIQTEIDELTTQLNQIPFNDVARTPLENQITARKAVSRKLEKKIETDVLPSRIYDALIMTAIAVSMCLIVFPPTSVVGIWTLAGSIAVLATGSIFGGIGRRLFNSACDLGSSLWNKITGDTSIPIAPLPTAPVGTNVHSRMSKVISSQRNSIKIASDEQSERKNTENVSGEKSDPEEIKSVSNEQSDPEKRESVSDGQSARIKIKNIDIKIDIKIQNSSDDLNKRNSLEKRSSEDYSSSSSFPLSENNINTPIPQKAGRKFMDSLTLNGRKPSSDKRRTYDPTFYGASASTNTHTRPITPPLSSIGSTEIPRSTGIPLLKIPEAKRPRGKSF